MPDVRHRGFGQHTGNISGSERLLQSGDVVELDHFRGNGRVHRGPILPGRGPGVPSAARWMKVSSTVP